MVSLVGGLRLHVDLRQSIPSKSRVSVQVLQYSVYGSAGGMSLEKGVAHAVVGLDA